MIVIMMMVVVLVVVMVVVVMVFSEFHRGGLWSFLEASTVVT